MPCSFRRTAHIHPDPSRTSCILAQYRIPKNRLQHTVMVSFKSQDVWGKEQANTFKHGFWAESVNLVCGACFGVVIPNTTKAQNWQFFVCFTRKPRTKEGKKRTSKSRQSDETLFLLCLDWSILASVSLVYNLNSATATLQNDENDEKWPQHSRLVAGFRSGRELLLVRFQNLLS